MLNKQGPNKAFPCMRENLNCQQTTQFQQSCHDLKVSHYFNPYSAGIDFRRQILKIPAL